MCKYVSVQKGARHCWTPIGAHCSTEICQRQMKDVCLLYFSKVAILNMFYPYWLPLIPSDTQFREVNAAVNAQGKRALFINPLYIKTRISYTSVVLCILWVQCMRQYVHIGFFFYISLRNERTICFLTENVWVISSNENLLLLKCSEKFLTPAILKIKKSW